MERKTAKWEAELWSYLSTGDGAHCPIYQSCQLRGDNIKCLSEHQAYCQAINEFIDSEGHDLAGPASIEFPGCPRSGRIFKLVRSLAKRYLVETGIDRPPIPTDLVTQADDNLPIEVRQVSLKAHHGAVWRLSDCWIVQLNADDAPDRQRFTLYHEIFHIMAHCKANPVFKKESCHQEGSFNELLADHFAGVILTPFEWVRKIWPEVKDISQMAATFNVPKPVMWFALKHLRLI